MIVYEKKIFALPIKERRFYHEARIKISRREAREHLEQFHLACELAKLIRHHFPDLLPLLKQLPDPRNQSYITYPGVILLMTCILSSLFYISSMRKTSEEFNSEIMIKNVWTLCKEEAVVDELPYWETCKKGKKKGNAEIIRKEFWFLTDLPVTRKNVAGLTERRRMRWRIENEGFNAQKNHGYYLEHLYSRNYQALKNHYYLIQIGHVIGQFPEAWERTWKKVKQSMEQKYKRMLESMKELLLEEYKEEPDQKMQIRFI